MHPQPLCHLAIAALRCIPKLLGYQFPLLLSVQMPAREVQLPGVNALLRLGQASADSYMVEYFIWAAWLSAPNSTC